MFYHKLSHRARSAGISTISLSLLLSLHPFASKAQVSDDVVRPMDTPLPIDWLSFRANPAGSTVQLDWTTSSDGMAATFYVQRSTDGQTWTNVGSVPGLASKLAQVYFYQDSLPLNGTSYYRLARVVASPNDTPQVSWVQAVTFDQPLTYLVHPNPVRGQLHLSLLTPSSQHVELLLLSVDGRPLKTETWSVSTTQQELDMDLGGVPSGLYFLDIVDDRGSHPQKIAVL